MGIQSKPAQIGFNVGFDISKSIKAYVYKLPNLKRGKEFLKPNSTALITASADVTSDFTSYEIDIVVVGSDGETIKQGSSTSVLNKELRRNKSFYAYLQDYKGKADNDSIYAMTLLEPLDPTKHQNKEQLVFYVSDINATFETPENLTGTINGKGVTEFTLLDFNLIEDEYTNAEALFNLDDSFNKGEITNIKLDLQSQSLLNSLEVKGLQDNGLTDNVAIETDSSLTPFLVNIIETQDKVSIYLPWWDHDFVLPLAYAKLFTQKAKLSAVLKQERQQKLLLDLLLVSYAYADDFAFVEYVTSGTDAGKIKGDQYIGWNARQASSMTSKQPVEVVDSIFERYIRENPQDETSDELRQIQEFIAALSRYINSSKAIGKGNNSFNKIYLPFVLRPFGSLTIKKIKVPNPIPGLDDQVDSFVLQDADNEFTLESLYFGFSPGKIVNDKKQLLSELKQVQTDRKNTLPILSDNIKAINKLPLPGDIDTKSDKDIQYLFYIKIDEDKLQQFFATTETINSKIPVGTEITVTETPYEQYGKSYKNPIDLFNDLGYKGQFVSGTLESKTLTKTITGQVRQSDFDKKLSILQGTELPLAIELSIPSNNFNTAKYSLSLFTKNYIDYQRVSWFAPLVTFPLNQDITKTITVKYEVPQFRLINLKYITSSSSGIDESALKRKAIFDKYTWKKKIDEFSIDPSNPDSKYTLNIDLETPVKQIDEITIRQLYGEEITIHVSGLSRTITLFNKYDETIGIHRILFR